MKHSEIRTALEQHLVAMCLPDGTIAWPGQKFTPPIGSVWHRPSILPGGVDAECGAGGALHQNGTYQVSCFAPPGSGTTEIHAAVDLVAAHFDRVSLGYLSLGVPVIGPLFEEVDWLHIPVSIPYTVL